MHRNRVPRSFQPQPDSPVSTADGGRDCFVLAPDCVKYLLDKVCAATATKCVAKHYSTGKSILVAGFLRSDQQFVGDRFEKERVHVTFFFSFLSLFPDVHRCPMFREFLYSNSDSKLERNETKRNDR